MNDSDSEAERTNEEDFENGNVEEVDNILEDSTWLKDPNEKIMDVEVEGDVDNERN